MLRVLGSWFSLGGLGVCGSLAAYAPNTGTALWWGFAGLWCIGAGIALAMASAPPPKPAPAPGSDTPPGFVLTPEALDAIERDAVAGALAMPHVTLALVRRVRELEREVLTRANTPKAPSKGRKQ